MFDQLFSQPSTLARHRHSPYAVERRRYLSHLMEEGHSRSNLLDIAAVLISLARHLPLHQPTIFHAEIEASAEAWTKTIHRSAKCLIVGKRQFIFHATNWMRLLGRLREPRVMQPFAAEMDDFL